MLGYSQFFLLFINAGASCLCSAAIRTVLELSASSYQTVYLTEVPGSMNKNRSTLSSAFQKANRAHRYPIEKAIASVLFLLLPMGFL